MINALPSSESRIATDDLICKFDVHLQLTYANESFCRFVGCSEGGLGGRSLLDLFPDDRQQISELISQMLANPRCLTFETHTAFHGGEGSGLCWLAIPQLDENGEISEVQACCVIQHPVSAAINPSNGEDSYPVEDRNLRMLLATINEMVFLLSPKGYILRFNPAVTEKLGYSPEAIRGKQIKLLLEPEVSDEMDGILTKIHQISAGTFHLPFLTASGEPRHVEMDLSVGVWNEKEMIIAICRDITYRVEIEKSEREQRMLASALANVASILNSTLNMEEVEERILENVGNVIPNTSCNIMSVEGDQARIIRSRGYDVKGTEELLLARVFDLNKMNTLHKMAITLEPIVSGDTSLDPNWTLLPESFWVHSYVAAPITFQGKLFGFINCDSDQPGFYTREHAWKLKLFADQAGIAMENAILFSETRRHARQMTLLNDLTRVSLSSENFSTLLEKLPAQLAALFQATNVYITRVERDQTVSCIATTHPHRSTYINHITEPIENSLTLSCLNLDKAIYQHYDLESDSNGKKKSHPYAEHNLLALPIRDGINKIGAIIVGFGSNYAISDVDTAIGEYAASQIAPLMMKMVSFDNERSLAEQLNRTNQLITALGKVGVEIVRAADQSAVLNSLGAELEKISIHNLVLLSDKVSGPLDLRYVSQGKAMQEAIEKLLPDYFPEFNRKLSELTLIYSVLQNGTPQFLDGLEKAVMQHMPEILSPFRRRLFSILHINEETAAILIPLTTSNGVMGILILWGDQLKKIDLEAFSLFGFQASAALENATLVEKVKQLANTDELTGIFNRRGINTYGQRALEVAARLNQPLSAILLDLDHLKKINDSGGHSVGDEVLCEVVKRCKDNIREIDLLGRYGGDEFLLLLIGSTMDQAAVIAERLRKLVEQNVIHTEAGNLNVTISLGVTATPPAAGMIDKLIATADAALYQAKNNGRNQVVVWKESGI